jgi:hypothetical protein
MKTILKDSDITVINLPKDWEYSNFDINAEISWNIIIENYPEYCKIKVQFGKIQINLCYKGTTILTYYKFDFLKMGINFIPDKKGIIKPESMEINFEEKTLIIS